MPPSQLKQLKASLRDTGVLGQQQSKKKRKANAKDADKRLQRNAALEGIRERFNPFEVKAPARREKFEITSGRAAKPSIGRPGVTRGLGEERRKDTLLKEIQARNKVGGVFDRRFGENDPTMTPEQRAAERFARQNDRKIAKNSMFNLEDDSGEEMALTHGGRALDLADGVKDDYQDNDSDLSDDGDADDRPRKRLRASDDEADQVEEDGFPQRKKTKNEVMKEVIAKSKMHKAERQAAKEDDEDLRLELDKGMSEFYEALRGHKPPEKPLPTPPEESEPLMNPARAAMLAGKSREAAEKEYEANLRQMKMDARSQPSVRTKTDEEKAAEEAARLQELERDRIRRMKGEPDSSEDEAEIAPIGLDEDSDRDDAGAFGLSQPELAVSRKELDVEDEDEFVLDDDLVASESEAEMASGEDEDDESDSDVVSDDGDDDFINGLVLPTATSESKIPSASKKTTGGSLAFTYPCPETLSEFLDITKDADSADLPTIVQRIRALYHKSLAQENQEKLAKFASVLTELVAYLAANKPASLLPVLESLLRHLHSMAKTQPEAVGVALRAHLSEIAEKRPLALTVGDLIILTGISTIFPTSDHFHGIVTPAMLSLGRYLGQSQIHSLRDLAVGAYACSLALQYQQLARRYVPEVINYIVSAIAALSPTPLPQIDNHGKPLHTSVRPSEHALRITIVETLEPSKISFRDLYPDSAQTSPIQLINTFVKLSSHVANLWSTKTAFPEIIAPLIHATKHLSTLSSKQLPKTTLHLATQTHKYLVSLQTTSLTNRKPLLLHNHKPLAIKSSIPAFIENYNPDRHYDPDQDRAQLSKLKAEHKKERKGAMRELRKDANFIAREQLREKKEKDAAYDKKFKRLVAEIQGEEGREAKDYSREKERRKAGRRRM